LTTRRPWRYRRYWDQLIDLYGRLCYYCREEIATTIDHVIPNSYDFDDTIENLVPACAFCNQLASDKHFEDIEQKTQFILTRRSYKSSRRAICVDCYLPFWYRVHSPSLFLCAECYDRQYDTAKARKPQWLQWLVELRAADIIPEAHAVLRMHAHKFRSTDRIGKTNYLADAYDRYYRNLPENNG